VVVGNTVRAASRSGVPGVEITGAMIDDAAVAHTGRSWGLTGTDLSAVLDPWQIVRSRTAQGGAAPDALHKMVTSLQPELADLAAVAERRTERFDRAESALLAQARAVIG